LVYHDTLTYGEYPDNGPAICRGFYDAYASRSLALILLCAFRRLTEVPPPGALSAGYSSWAAARATDPESARVTDGYDGFV
jgi:hypothetical protein